GAWLCGFHLVLAKADKDGDVGACSTLFGVRLSGVRSFAANTPRASRLAVFLCAWTNSRRWLSGKEPDASAGAAVHIDRAGFCRWAKKGRRALSGCCARLTPNRRPIHNCALRFETSVHLWRQWQA